MAFASLNARDVTVVRGRLTTLESIDLALVSRHRVGVVGPNGVGKTTLLRVLAGEIRPDMGVVTTMPPDATVGYLPQERSRLNGETVRDYLVRRTGVGAASAELDTATAALAGTDPDAGDRYSVALDRWMNLGGTDLEARIGEAWASLGLSATLIDQPTASLSGGEAARAGLAALILSRYDVYLLDEPTNDLDTDGLAVLERWIEGLSAPVALVSHDRAFLDTIVTDVFELDEFSHRGTLYAGGWATYQAERQVARRRAEEAFEVYDTKRAGLASRAQREREWATQGLSKAKKKPTDNDKNIKAFKINQTEQLAGKAARTEKAMERLEVVDSPRKSWDLHLTFAEAPRSGAIVARLDRAVVERGSFTLGPVDLLIGFGERVAIVGTNGSGKTTLVDALVGRAELTSGERHLGPSVVVGEIEQARGQLTGADSLLTAFMSATGMKVVSDARTLLAKFGIVAAHVDRPTSSLSPGERTRAVLALLMARGANCLILDEPTNHLDLPAIEQLEQALDTFGGTVLLITHDRQLLDHVHLDRMIRLKNGQIVLDTAI